MRGERDGTFITVVGLPVGNLATSAAVPNSVVLDAWQFGQVLFVLIEPGSTGIRGMSMELAGPSGSTLSCASDNALWSCQ